MLGLSKESEWGLVWVFLVWFSSASFKSVSLGLFGEGYTYAFRMGTGEAGLLLGSPSLWEEPSSRHRLLE